MAARPVVDRAALGDPLAGPGFQRRPRPGVAPPVVQRGPNGNGDTDSKKNKRKHWSERKEEREEKKKKEVKVEKKLKLEEQKNQYKSRQILTRGEQTHLEKLEELPEDEGESMELERPKYPEYEVALDGTGLWTGGRPSGWKTETLDHFFAEGKEAGRETYKKRPVYKAIDGNSYPRKRHKKKGEDYIDIGHKKAWQEWVLSKCDPKVFTVEHNGEEYQISAYAYDDVWEAYNDTGNLQLEPKSGNRKKSHKERSRYDGVVQQWLD